MTITQIDSDVDAYTFAQQLMFAKFETDVYTVLYEPARSVQTDDLLAARKVIQAREDRERGKRCSKVPVQALWAVWHAAWDQVVANER